MHPPEASRRAVPPRRIGPGYGASPAERQASAQSRSRTRRRPRRRRRRRRRGARPGRWPRPWRASWCEPCAAGRPTWHRRPRRAATHPEEVDLAVGPPAQVVVGDAPGTRGRSSVGVARHPAQRRPGEQLEATPATRPGCRAGRRPGCRRAGRTRTAWPAGWRSASTACRRCGRAPPSRVEVAHAHAAAGDEGVAPAATPSRSAASSARLVVGHAAEVDRLRSRPRATRASSIGGSSRGSGRGPGARPASTSSSPVESTPTAGAADDAGTVRDADAGQHAEVGRASAACRRGRRRRRPGCRRRPAGRGADGRPPRALDHGPPPRRSVRSTMTTASAPAGMGAPVMIRIASPGPTGAVGGPAAAIGGDDAEAHRRGLAALRRCRRPAPRSRPSPSSRTAAPSSSDVTRLRGEHAPDRVGAAGRRHATERAAARTPRAPPPSSSSGITPAR